MCIPLRHTTKRFLAANANSALYRWASVEYYQYYNSESGSPSASRFIIVSLCLFIGLISPVLKRIAEGRSRGQTERVFTLVRSCETAHGCDPGKNN